LLRCDSSLMLCVDLTLEVAVEKSRYCAVVENSVELLLLLFLFFLLERIREGGEGVMAA
jgi:hypothetical protein